MQLMFEGNTALRFGVDEHSRRIASHLSLLGYVEIRRQHVSIYFNARRRCSGQIKLVQPDRRQLKNSDERHSRSHSI